MLDVERFNVALSNTLSSFPLLAGRLVRPDTPHAPWKVCFLFFPPLIRANHGIQVRLTNSGVPVSLIDSDVDEITPTDLAAQATLPPLEPLNTPEIINTEGESDEPLLRITITRFTKLNSTSIGICNSHVLRAFSLEFPRPCVDGSDFSRRIQPSAIYQTNLSAIPGPRTDRPPALLRNRSDQVYGTT